MANRAPDYPGYKAPECNGCGLCCLTIPCSVSVQFGLWKRGKCRALRFAAGRYWCDAVIDPRRVSVRLARYDKARIADAIGAGHGCDHRHESSVDAALTSLAERSMVDEIYESSEDTFPRACVVHLDDGTDWVVMIESPQHPPTIQRCLSGRPFGPIKTLEPAAPAE